MSASGSSHAGDEDLTLEERKELNEKLGFEGTTVFGKLLKINAQHTEWSYRWCVHDGGRIMYYYDSKSDAIRRKNGSAIVLRNGVLRVGRCEESRVDAAKTRRNFSFLSIKAPPFNHVFSIDTTERQFKFCSRKEDEMLRWAQSLARVMDEKKVAEAHMARRELANIFVLEHTRRLAEAERIAAASKAALRRSTPGASTDDLDGDMTDADLARDAEQSVVKQIVTTHKLPQPPRNLVVYVRRIVDARLPEPSSEERSAKCVTMKLLMGMQKERCGTNHIQPERRPLRNHSGAAAAGPAKIGVDAALAGAGGATGAAGGPSARPAAGADVAKDSVAALDAADAKVLASSGGGTPAPATATSDERYRVLFERAAVFVCPPNPSRVGTWEHSVRTTRVGHLQSIAKRGQLRENAFRRKVGLESLEEQVERVRDGITLDDDTEDEEEDEDGEEEGEQDGGASGAGKQPASGAGADGTDGSPSAKTAIVTRGRLRAQAIDAQAASLRRGPYGEMGVGAVPREFATMLRAARAAEVVAKEAADAGAGASESKEGGSSEKGEASGDGGAHQDENGLSDVQRLQQAAVAAAAAATGAASNSVSAADEEAALVSEAEFLHREADEMDDEEGANSLQLLANLKIGIQIRRGMGRSSRLAYSAEIPLDKLMLKAHEPQRVVVSLPIPDDSDDNHTKSPPRPPARDGTAKSGGHAGDGSDGPGEPGSLDSYDAGQHLIMPTKGSDLTDAANFDARKAGEPPRFCKDAELHLVLLWTDANVPALQKTVGYGDPQLRMAFPDLMRALDNPESRRQLRKGGDGESASLYQSVDTPLGRITPNGDLQGFMSGTRLAVVLRCAFAMADQDRKDRRAFLRYACRALSRYGSDGLLEMSKRVRKAGDVGMGDSSESESESEDEMEEIHADDLTPLTPRSEAAQALLEEASDSDQSETTPDGGNWSGLAGDSGAAIKGERASSSRHRSSRRKRRHRKSREQRSQHALQQELRGGTSRRVTKLSLKVVGVDDVFPHDDAVSDNEGPAYESDGEAAGQPWMYQLQEAMRGALNPDADTDTEAGSDADSSDGKSEVGPRRRLSRVSSVSGPRSIRRKVSSEAGSGIGDSMEDLEAMHVDDSELDDPFAPDPSLAEEKRWAIARRPREACMVTQFIKGRKVSVEGDGVGTMQTGVRLQAKLPSMLGMARYSLDCAERITNEKAALIAAGEDPTRQAREGHKHDVDLDQLTTKLVAGTYIVRVQVLSVQDLVEPELPGMRGTAEPDPVRDVQEGHEQREALKAAMQVSSLHRRSGDSDEDGPSTPIGATAMGAATGGFKHHDEEETAKFAPPTGRLIKPLLRIVTPQDETLVRPTGRPEFIPMPWYQRAVRRFRREFQLHKRRAHDDDKTEHRDHRGGSSSSVGKEESKEEGSGGGRGQIAVARRGLSSSRMVSPTLPSRLWFLNDLGTKPHADARATSWPLGFSRKFTLKDISIDMRRKTSVRVEVFDEAPEVRLGMAKIEARQRRARREVKRKAAEAAAEAARRGELDAKVAARLAAMVRHADEEEEEADVNADNFTGLGAPIGYIEIPFEWLLLREMAMREAGKGGKPELQQAWVGLMPSPLTFNRAQGGRRSGVGSITPSGCAGFVRIQVDVEGPISAAGPEDRGEVASQGVQGSAVHRASTSSFSLVTTPGSAPSLVGPGGTIRAVPSERDVLAAGLADVGPSRATGPENDSASSTRQADLARRAEELTEKAERLINEAKAKAAADGTKGTADAETPVEARKALAEADRIRSEMMEGDTYSDTQSTSGAEMDARTAIGALGMASDEAELKRGLRRAAREQARLLMQEKVSQASLHHSFSRWVNVLMPATVQPKLHWLVVGIHRVIDIPAMNSSMLAGQRTDLYVRVKCGGSVYQTKVNVIQGKPPLQAELNEQVRIPVWFPLPTFGQAQQLLTNRSRAAAGDMATDVSKHLRQQPFKDGQQPWDFRDMGEEGACTYGRISVGLFDHESHNADQCIGFCHLSVHDVIALQREQERQRNHRQVLKQRLERRAELAKRLREYAAPGPTTHPSRSSEHPDTSKPGHRVPQQGKTSQEITATTPAERSVRREGDAPGEMPGATGSTSGSALSDEDRIMERSMSMARPKKTADDDAASVGTEASGGPSDGGGGQRTGKKTGLGPAWVAMYGSPTNQSMYGHSDERSRAMETDPRVAVQYRGMVLLSARVEGLEMDAPRDVYMIDGEADEADENDSLDLHAAHGGMADHIDSMQQSACSRIISKKEDNRVARDQAATDREVARMEQADRRAADREAQRGFVGALQQGATALNDVGKEFELSVDMIGKGVSSFGSGIADRLVAQSGGEMDAASAAVSSVELMPSYMRQMPALPVARLSQFFTRYSLVALVVSGTELPDKQNLRIRVTCGQIEMHTQYENVIGGMAYWQTQLSRKKVVLPRNPSQIPDIIVALESGAGTEIGHVRIPAPTLLGQRWRTKPTWFHLVPNPLGIAGFKRGKFWRGHGGSLLMLIGMGKLSRTVPEEVWNHKLLGEGRIPPDQVAARINHSRLSTWRRQLKLIREYRKSRDSRQDLETVAFAKVRHLVRMSDAAQEASGGSRLARVVLPNKSVVLYAVAQTEGKRIAAMKEREEDEERMMPKSALARSSRRRASSGKRRVAFVGIGPSRQRSDSDVSDDHAGADDAAEKGAEAEGGSSASSAGDDSQSASSGTSHRMTSPARGAGTTMQISIDTQGPPALDSVAIKKRFAEGLAPLDSEGYSGAESEDDEARATRGMAEGFARMFVERSRRGSQADPLLEYIDKEDPEPPELLEPSHYEQWKTQYVTDPKYYWLPLPRIILSEAGKRMRNEFSTEQLGWGSQINRLLAKSTPGGIESYQLRINVFSARHLPAADKGGTSDPYIAVIFGETRTETRVRMRELHPVFNQSVAINAELPSHSLTPQVLLEVWDKDILSAHDRLGSCRVPLDYAYLVDSAALYEESKKEIRERGLEGSVDEEIDPNKSMPAPAWIPFVPEQVGNWRVGDGVGLLPSSASMLETVRDPEDQRIVESAAGADGDAGSLTSDALLSMRQSFSAMLGMDDSIRRHERREAMLARFRAHLGQTASNASGGVNEHHEHPLLGLGDGGRGFAGVPSNPLELAVLHGNDHEANEAALASNPELAAAIRRRRRLAEQLLSAHTEVSFDLTPTESPLEAKRKRLRAKRRREKRQARLKAVLSRQAKHEDDAISESQAQPEAAKGQEKPVLRGHAPNKLAPKRPARQAAAALMDDLELEDEAAPQLKTVVPPAARSESQSGTKSSSMAIRASRDSHLLRVARLESTGVGAVAVAAGKHKGTEGTMGRPRIERLTKELVRREEDRLNNGGDIDDPLVVARLQRLRALKRAAKRIMHNMQMGIVGNSFPARPEVLASMQLIPRIFKVDETNVDSKGRQLFVTKGIPIPIQPATTLLPSKRPVKALIVLLHARGITMPEGSKQKAPSLQYALTNVSGPPKHVQLARMPTSDDQNISSGMLGLLQRLGKAVSAAAKKAAQAIGGGGSGSTSKRTVPGPRLTMAAAAGFSPATSSASSVSNKLDDLYVGRHYYCKQLELKSWLPLDDSEEFEKAKRRRDMGESRSAPKTRAGLIREIRERNRQKRIKGKGGLRKSKASVKSARMAELEEEIDMAATQDPRKVRTHPWLARISPRLHLSVTTGGGQGQSSFMGMFGGDMVKTLADASIPIPTDKIPYVKYSAIKAAQEAKKSLAVLQANATYSDRLGEAPDPGPTDKEIEADVFENTDVASSTSSAEMKRALARATGLTGPEDAENIADKKSSAGKMRKSLSLLMSALPNVAAAVVQRWVRQKRRNKILAAAGKNADGLPAPGSGSSMDALLVANVAQRRHALGLDKVGAAGANASDATNLKYRTRTYKELDEEERKRKKELQQQAKGVPAGKQAGGQGSAGGAAASALDDESHTTEHEKKEMESSRMSDRVRNNWAIKAQAQRKDYPPYMKDRQALRFPLGIILPLSPAVFQDYILFQRAEVVNTGSARPAGYQRAGIVRAFVKLIDENIRYERALTPEQKQAEMDAILRGEKRPQSVTPMYQAISPRIQHILDLAAKPAMVKVRMYLLVARFPRDVFFPGVWETQDSRLVEAWRTNHAAKLVSKTSTDGQAASGLLGGVRRQEKIDEEAFESQLSLWDEGGPKLCRPVLSHGIHLDRFGIRPQPGQSVDAARIALESENKDSRDSRRQSGSADSFATVGKGGGKGFRSSLAGVGSTSSGAAGIEMSQIERTASDIGLAVHDVDPDSEVGRTVAAIRAGVLPEELGDDSQDLELEGTSASQLVPVVKVPGLPPVRALDYVYADELFPMAPQHPVRSSKRVVFRVHLGGKSIEVKPRSSSLVVSGDPGLQFGFEEGRGVGGWANEDAAEVDVFECVELEVPMPSVGMLTVEAWSRGSEGFSPAQTRLAKRAKEARDNVDKPYSAFAPGFETTNRLKTKDRKDRRRKKKQLQQLKSKRQQVIADAMKVIETQKEMALATADDSDEIEDDGSSDDDDDEEEEILVEEQIVLDSDEEQEDIVARELEHAAQTEQQNMASAKRNVVSATQGLQQVAKLLPGGQLGSNIIGSAVDAVSPDAVSEDKKRRTVRQQLLGGFMVDLEQRWLHPSWHSLGQKFAHDKRMRVMPLETRTLRNANGHEVGTVQCWIDVLQQEMAKKFPPLMVRPPPPMEMEVRVVVWRIRYLPELTPEREGPVPYFVRSWLHKRGIDYERASRLTRMQDGAERVRYPGEQRSCTALSLPAWEARDLFHAIDIAKGRHAKNDAAGTATRPSEDELGLDDFDAELEWAKREAEKRRQDFLARTAPPGTKAVSSKAGTGEEIPQNETPAQRRRRERRERQNRFLDARAQYVTTGAPQPYQGFLNWRMRMPMQYARWGRLEMPGPLMMEVCEALPENEPANDRAKSYKEIETEFRRKMTAAGTDSRNECWARRWRALGAGMIDITDLVKRASLRPMQRTRVVPEHGHYGVQESHFPMAWLPLRTTRKPIAHLNEEDFEGDEKLALQEATARAVEGKAENGQTDATSSPYQATGSQKNGLAATERPDDLGKATATGKAKLDAARKMGVRASSSKHGGAPTEGHPIEVLLSVEIVPREFSDSQAKEEGLIGPPSAGREAPNALPYLKDPQLIWEQIRARRPQKCCGGCCSLS